MNFLKVFNDLRFFSICLIVLKFERLVNSSTKILLKKLKNVVYIGEPLLKKIILLANPSKGNKKMFSRFAPFFCIGLFTQ